MASATTAPVERLTSPQRACLRLVGRGLQSKEIARELGISPNTVDTYLRDANTKLGVSSRLEAARILAAHEGIPPSQWVRPAPLRLSASDAEQPSSPGEIDQRPAFPPPLPIRRGPENDLTIWQRIMWIAFFMLALPAAALLTLSLGKELSGLLP